MRRGAIAGFCAALLVASCGASPTVGSVPSATTTTSATAAPTPAPTTSGPPTAKPVPLTSLKGTITVTQPLRGDQVMGAVTIAGEASVFEAALRWRVVTTGGMVLAEGSTTASAGAPLKGTFKTDVTFAPPSYGEAGFVEVFEVSPKDGSISDIVRVPVGIAGSY